MFYFYFLFNLSNTGKSFMLCGNCSSETPSNQPYCVVCGHEHRLSHEEVQEMMKEELLGEKEESTQNQIQQVLAFILCVLFCISIWNSLYQNPKRCYIVPFYSEDIVIPDHYPVPGFVSQIDVVEKSLKVRRKEEK
jgi:hypothetical protein